MSMVKKKNVRQDEEMALRLSSLGYQVNIKGVQCFTAPPHIRISWIDIA
jgi:hypothetical protein